MIISRKTCLDYLRLLTKRPSDTDEQGLIQRYFHPAGNRNDEYFASIAHRAYLDLNRTLRGISKLPSRRSLHDAAVSALWERASGLCSSAETVTQGSFDNSHKETCLVLREIYTKGGWPMFSIGQAQKWTNMTFKYAFVLGEQRLPGFLNLFKLCHVPLDNIIFEQVRRRYGQDWTKPAWSRISNYDEYMNKQTWFRNSFKWAPLYVEFQLWQGGNVSDGYTGEATE